MDTAEIKAVTAAEGAPGAAPGPAPGPDGYEDLRLRVRAIIDAAFGGVSAAAARDADIPASTFSAWIAASYRGDRAKVARQVEDWLEARAARSGVAGLAPSVPGYIATPTAQRVQQVCMQAQALCDFALIAGVAGIGKTTALRAYVERSPNTWMVTAEPLLRSPHSILEEIGRALGVTERSTSRISGALVARLRDRQGLIVIDEAHQLTTEAFDQVRSLHDKAQVGVVAAGNIETGTRLEGAGRAAQFAPLWSRIGMRRTWGKPLPGDVEALLDAWGLIDKACRAWLIAGASKGGALRTVTKTLRLAAILASGEQAEVGLKHLKAAHQQLTNGGAH